MENTKITSVDAEQTQYSALKKVANFLNIDANGLSRQELADKINAEIQNRGGEIEMEAETEIKIPQVNEPAGSDKGVPVIGEKTDSTETSETEATPAAESAPKRRGRKPKDPNAEPVVKAPKWHEVEGYGNKPGDKVIILGKNIHTETDNPKVILQGRTAVVIGPSKKANTIQAKLLDEGTGGEQGCIITLKKGEYADHGTVDVAIPPRKTRKKAETAPTAEQPADAEVAAGSETPVAPEAPVNSGESTGGEAQAS